MPKQKKGFDGKDDHGGVVARPVKRPKLRRTAKHGLLEIESHG